MSDTDRFVSQDVYTPPPSQRPTGLSTLWCHSFLLTRTLEREAHQTSKLGPASQQYPFSLSYLLTATPALSGVPVCAGCRPHLPPVNLIISCHVWHTCFPQQALGWSLCHGSSPSRRLTVFSQCLSLKVAFFPLVPCVLFSTAPQTSLPLPSPRVHPHFFGLIYFPIHCLTCVFSEASDCWSGSALGSFTVRSWPLQFNDNGNSWSDGTGL